MKKIAVVILNWNGKSWLEKFLPTVLKYSESAQIYVVDNASTDDSVSFLENNFPSVKVIQNAQNSGFAGGYNDGLKQMKEEIYCLLNSDVEVTEGWLEPVLDLFQQNPEIAAIQPKILSYDRKNYFEFAGAGFYTDIARYSGRQNPCRTRVSRFCRAGYFAARSDEAIF